MAASSIALLVQHAGNFDMCDRVRWHIRNINKFITSVPNSKLEDDLTLIAVNYPKDITGDSSGRDDAKSSRNLLSRASVGMDTQILFLSKSYRMVVVLDLSPSVTNAVDCITGQVVLDLMLQTLRKVLRALAMSAHLPEQSDPIVLVSVVCAGHKSIPADTLIHGAVLNISSIDALISQVENQIMQLDAVYSSDHGTSSFEEGITDLSNIIERSILPLQSMPLDASPAILLITDGAISPIDSRNYDTILSQLRREDIMLHAFAVTPSLSSSISSGHMAYGCVADSSMLRHVTRSTGGTYFAYEDTDLSTLFIRKSRLTTDRFRPGSMDDNYHYAVVEMAEAELTSDVPLDWIVSARVKEGFEVAKVVLTPRERDAICGYDFVLRWLPTLELVYEIRSMTAVRYKDDAEGIGRRPSHSVRVKIGGSVELVGMIKAYVGLAGDAAMDAATRKSLQQMRLTLSEYALQTLDAMREMLRKVQETDRVLQHIALLQGQSEKVSLSKKASRQVRFESGAYVHLAGCPVSDWLRWFHVKPLSVLTTPDDRVWSWKPTGDAVHTTTKPTILLGLLRSILSRFCSHEITPQLHLREATDDMGRRLSSFVLIRTEHHSPYLAVLHVAFFATAPTNRRDTMLSLVRALTEAERHTSFSVSPRSSMLTNLTSLARGTRSTGLVTSWRNVGRLLIQRVNANDAMVIAEVERDSCYSFAIPSPLNLRGYLRSFRSVWPCPSKAVALQVFQVLVELRHADGFGALCLDDTTSLFGRDINVNQGDIPSPCWLQYLIALDEHRGSIVTDFFMEPQVGSIDFGDAIESGRELRSGVAQSHFERVTSRLLANDTHVISSILTMRCIRLKHDGLLSSWTAMAAGGDAFSTHVTFSVSRVLKASQSVTELYKKFRPQVLPAPDSTTPAKTGSGPNDWLFELLQLSIASIMDGEVPTVDASFSDILQERVNLSGVSTEGTDTAVAPRDRCWASIVDATSMMLLVLPPSHVVEATALDSTTSSAGPPGSSYHSVSDKVRHHNDDYLAVTIFRCSHLEVDLTPAIPLGDGPGLASPRSRQASRAGQASKLSRFAAPDAFNKIFLRIGHLHEANFVHASYLALRKGIPIEAAEIDSAYNSCIEITELIDITVLKHVVRSATAKGSAPVQLDVRMREYIGKAFTQVPGKAGAYFYSGPLVGDPDGEEDDAPSLVAEEDEDRDGEEMGEGDRRTVGGEPLTPPLFMSVSVALDKPGDDLPEKNAAGRRKSVTAPILDAAESLLVTDSLTSVLLALGGDVKPLEHLNLLGSDTDRTTLRIVFRMMPQSSAGRKRSVKGRDSLPSLKSLPKIQLIRLRNFMQMLKELNSAEILRSLKTSMPVSETSISLVKRHMQNLPRASLTKRRFKLNFIFQEPGLLVFRQELLKSRFIPVECIRDVYFVVQRDTAAVSSYNVPYWILLGIQGSDCVIEFHHPRSSVYYATRLDIVRTIESGLAATVRLTNQQLLLSQVYDTKSLSPLLIPLQPSLSIAPSEADVSTSTPVDESVTDLDGSSLVKVEASAFACDVQFSIRLPLYHLIKTKRAMAFVAKKLQNFQVNAEAPAPTEAAAVAWFVYKEVKEAVHVPGTPVQDNIYYIRLQAEESSLISGESGAPASSSVVDGALVMNVYGVVPPGVAITEDLVRALESYLVECSFAYLSDMAGRSFDSKSKLREADILYIKNHSAAPVAPAGKGPTQSHAASVHCLVPLAIVVDPLLFTLFLKSCLLTSHQSLNVSNSVVESGKPNLPPDSATWHPACSRYEGSHDSEKMITETTLPKSDPSLMSPVFFSGDMTPLVHISPTDLAFVSSQDGLYVTCLRIVRPCDDGSLLSVDYATPRQRPLVASMNASGLSVPPLSPCYGDATEVAGLHGKGVALCVAVDAWCQAGLSASWLESVQSRLVQCISQALAEYQLEVSVLSAPCVVENRLSAHDLLTLERSFIAASELKCSLVHQISIPTLNGQGRTPGPAIHLRNLRSFVTLLCDTLSTLPGPGYTGSCISLIRPGGDGEPIQMSPATAVISAASVPQDISWISALPTTEAKVSELESMESAAVAWLQGINGQSDSYAVLSLSKEESAMSQASLDTNKLLVDARCNHQLMRQCAAFVTATATGLTISLYNWSDILVSRFIKEELAPLLLWAKRRAALLDSVLHQKMGLFRHMPQEVRSDVIPGLSTTMESVMVAPYRIDSLHLGSIGSLVQCPKPAKEETLAAVRTDVTWTAPTSTTEFRKEVKISGPRRPFNRFAMQKSSSKSSIDTDASTPSAPSDLFKAPRSTELPFAQSIMGAVSMASQASNAYNSSGDPMLRHCVPFAVLAQIQSHRHRRRAKLALLRSKLAKGVEYALMQSVLPTLRLLHSWRLPMAFDPTACSLSGKELNRKDPRQDDLFLASFAEYFQQEIGAKVVTLDGLKVVRDGDMKRLVLHSSLAGMLVICVASTGNRGGTKGVDVYLAASELQVLGQASSSQQELAAARTKLENRLRFVTFAYDLQIRSLVEGLHHDVWTPSRLFKGYPAPVLSALHNGIADFLRFFGNRPPHYGLCVVQHCRIRCSTMAGSLGVDSNKFSEVFVHLSEQAVRFDVASLSLPESGDKSIIALSLNKTFDPLIAPGAADSFLRKGSTRYYLHASRFASSAHDDWLSICVIKVSAPPLAGMRGLRLQGAEASGETVARELLVNGTKALVAAMTKASTELHRETLWRSVMTTAEPKRRIPMGPVTLIEFFSAAELDGSLQKLDPRVPQLLSKVDVNWLEVFEYFSNLHEEQTRVLEVPMGRCLIFFAQEDERVFVCVAVYDVASSIGGGVTVQASLGHRPNDLSEARLRSIKTTLLARFVKTVMHFIWRS